jgi:predicted nucleic acid-binding protein
MSFVVDASTTACWAFSDESEPVADWARDRLVQGSAHVPSLWWFELRNAMIMNERRKRIGEDDVYAFLARLSQLSIVIDRTPDGTEIMTLARRHRLTVYDAAYLELASRRAEPLATLDKKLAAAAAAENVKLIGAP